MFRRILVPLDGSRRAEEALPVAARLARASQGSLLLVRIATIEPTFYWSGFGPALIDEVLEGAQEEARQYLQRILATTPELQGLTAEVIVRTGVIAEALLEIAQEEHADLVVLCSHGYSGLKRWALGSVASRMVRHATMPVLVLREHGPALQGPQPGLERALRAVVPLDGSPQAKAALEPAALLLAALAAPSSAALHLVSVVEVDERAEDATSQQRRERGLKRAEHYLATTVEHIRRKLVAPALADLPVALTWSVIARKDVAHAIIDVAERGEEVEGMGVFGGCDFIAMATHGREGMARWTLGSVTERVLVATRLPVLVVRPPVIEQQVGRTWGSLAGVEANV